MEYWQMTAKEIIKKAVNVSIISTGHNHVYIKCLMCGSGFLDDEIQLHIEEKHCLENIFDKLVEMGMIK